uniref:FBA_2 domain-containing protein n=1 Tax=Panagrellus redivivus TaxID=6233 RepID=A0A7E4VAN3_PANRE
METNPVTQKDRLDKVVAALFIMYCKTGAKNIENIIHCIASTTFEGHTAIVNYASGTLYAHIRNNKLFVYHYRLHQPHILLPKSFAKYVPAATMDLPLIRNNTQITLNIKLLCSMPNIQKLAVLTNYRIPKACLRGTAQMFSNLKEMWCDGQTVLSISVICAEVKQLTIFGHAGVTNKALKEYWRFPALTAIHVDIGTNFNFATFAGSVHTISLLKDIVASLKWYAKLHDIVLHLMPTPTDLHADIRIYPYINSFFFHNHSDQCIHVISKHNVFGGTYVNTVQYLCQRGFVQISPKNVRYQHIWHNGVPFIHDVQLVMSPTPVVALAPNVVVEENELHNT